MRNEKKKSQENKNAMKAELDGKKERMAKGDGER